MLNRRTYFIREHVGMLKLTDTYDILDPETQQQIGIAKEEISGLLKVLRFFINKRMLPTCVNVYAGTTDQIGELQFSIKRSIPFLRSQVDVIDRSGKNLGYFKSKIFSLGGSFRVCLMSGEEVAQVKGDWKGWNFKFLSGEAEIGTITKKWGGLGKELFTSADNYMITISGDVDEYLSILLLAGGLAIDTVYKEA